MAGFRFLNIYNIERDLAYLEDLRIEPSIPIALLVINCLQTNELRFIFKLLIIRLVPVHTMQKIYYLWFYVDIYLCFLKSTFIKKSKAIYRT
jgi:hypothetical protein